jgi:hypothetical protein
MLKCYVQSRAHAADGVLILRKIAFLLIRPGWRRLAGEPYFVHMGADIYRVDDDIALAGPYV